jgi:hypothetical protein
VSLAKLAFEIEGAFLTAVAEDVDQLTDSQAHAFVEWQASGPVA